MKWILIYVVFIAGGEAPTTNHIEFDTELNCKIAETALGINFGIDADYMKVKSVCVPK